MALSGAAVAAPPDVSFLTSQLRGALAGCGNNASFVGNDGAGVITVGTGVVTTCTLNFSQTYRTAPVCVATGSNIVALGINTTTSTLVVTAVASLANAKVSYHCATP
jgi:hypothetical protein